MLELFGSQSCPHTQEMREWLEFSRRKFVEFDVDADPEAFARMRDVSGQFMVPVLLDGDRVLQIGWQGRGCIVSFPTAEYRHA